MTFIGAMALAGLILPGQAANDPERAAARQALAGRLAVMKVEAARYRLRSGPDDADRANLLPEPLLRWNNPVADEEDAALFLWVRRGRPEAAAQFFVRKENWMHEFQSLAPRPFEARWDDQLVWSPGAPGVRFRDLPGVPPPAATAAERSRQMRGIAGTFSGSVEFRYAGQSRYELRLLPRPVYRYGEGGAGEAIDGAIWAFVQGTNPEILLLIEARRAGDADREWRYALAPMTSYAAEVMRDGQSVWKVERQPIPTPTETGVYLFRDHVPLTGRGP